MSQVTLLSVLVSLTISPGVQRQPFSLGLLFISPGIPAFLTYVSTPSVAYKVFEVKVLPHSPRCTQTEASAQKTL